MKNVVFALSMALMLNSISWAIDPNKFVGESAKPQPEAAVAEFSEESELTALIQRIEALESRVDSLETAMQDLKAYVESKVPPAAPVAPPMQAAPTGASYKSSSGGSTGSASKSAYSSGGSTGSASKSAYATQDLVALHNSLHNPTGATSPNWSWPGDLRTHLETEHKVSNGVLLPRQRTTTSSTLTTSSCPGGVCPMPSASAQPFRIFRPFRR